MRRMIMSSFHSLSSHLLGRRRSNHPHPPHPNNRCARREAAASSSTTTPRYFGVTAAAIQNAMILSSDAIIYITVWILAALMAQFQQVHYFQQHQQHSNNNNIIPNAMYAVPGTSYHQRSPASSASLRAASSAVRMARGSILQRMVLLILALVFLSIVPILLFWTMYGCLELISTFATRLVAETRSIRSFLLAQATSSTYHHHYYNHHEHLTASMNNNNSASVINVHGGGGIVSTLLSSLLKEFLGIVFQVTELIQSSETLSQTGSQEHHHQQQQHRPAALAALSAIPRLLFGRAAPSAHTSNSGVDVVDNKQWTILLPWACSLFLVITIPLFMSIISHLYSDGAYGESFLNWILSSSGATTTNTTKRQRESQLSLLFRNIPCYRKILEERDICTLTPSSFDGSLRWRIPRAGESIYGNSNRVHWRTVDGACAVCFSPYKVHDAIVWSANPQCPHAFCQDCIVQWLATPAFASKRIRDPEEVDCPCCRRPFLVAETTSTPADKF